MVQFGVQLRQEREHRGVSLEAMCAATKLSVRQLIDVETGNFRELPGGIFRKGFVRSYLKALNLDEPIWLERFEASYRASGLAEAEVDWTDFAENVRNNRLGGNGSGTRNRWLGVLAMTILLLLFSLCVWKFVIVPKLTAHVQTALTAPVPPSVSASFPGPLKAWLARHYAGIHFVSAELEGGKMQRAAKIFMNNRSQAVRLP